MNPLKKIKNLIIPFIAIGLLSSTSAFADYSDVDENHKYSQAIDFITFQNIVSGYPDGTFQPNRVLNRAELLKIVIEANYIDEFEGFADQTCFTDTIPNEWYNQYVCFAKAEGIIEGYEDGTFRPESPINLVEATKIAMETFGFAYPGSKPWYQGLVEEAADRDFIPSDFTSFDQKVNRGQMAELITRILKYNVGTLDMYLGSEKNLTVTYESLNAGVFIEDWIQYTDETLGYTIMYPENFREVDFQGTGVGVGPQDMQEDILWLVRVYDSSEKSKEDVISETGSQFGDERSITREEVSLLDGVEGEKVIITTTELTDWYSETIIIEKDDQLYVISNGAIQDLSFDVFYKSFRFIQSESENTEETEDSYTPDTAENPFLPDIEDIVFAYFESPSFKFRVIYPNNWYYAGEASSEEGIQRHYYFSTENPFPEDAEEAVEVPVTVSMDIIDEALMIDEDSGELVDLGDSFALKSEENGVIEYYRNVGSRYFKFYATSDYEDIIIHMIANIELITE